MKKRKTPEGVGKRLFEKREKPIYDVDLKFNDDAEEEGYKRYKHRCYRNLVIKSLLYFLLGLLFFNHEEDTHSQPQGRNDFDVKVGCFSKANHGQKHRQNSAGFINGHNFVDVTHGKRLKVAQP